MAVIQSVSGVSCMEGDVVHRGWLPPGAATPLPTPVRRLTLDITIEEEGPGFLLIVTAREDLRFSHDTWCDSLADAEAMAFEQFGVGPDQWLKPSPQSELREGRRST